MGVDNLISAPTVIPIDFNLQKRVTMRLTQGKAIIPLVAVLGALVAMLGGLTAMLAVTGSQPVLLGITLAVSMILLVVLGIFIGLLRKRS